MEAWGNLKKKTITSRQKSSQNSETKVEQPVETDVYYTLVPTGYLNRICGLVPVKLIPNKNTKTSDKVDPGAVAYGIALALILSGAQFWGLYRDTRNGWQNSTRLFTKTAIAVTGSDVLFVICVTVFAIVGSSKRWHHLHHALEKIVQADVKLDMSTTPRINLRKFSIILIVCSMIYLISISTLDYVSWCYIIETKFNHTQYTDKGPINYSPLYFMYVVIVAMQMQYAIVLMNLSDRFSRLNYAIESLTKTNDIIDYFRKDMGLAAQERRREISRSFVSSAHSSQHKKNRHRRFNDRASDSIDSTEGKIYENSIRNAPETIDRLITVHKILCDSIVHVNKAYGVILLMCTLSCLTHLVITLYFLYAEISSANRRSYVVVRQIGWIIFHIYKMLLFVQPPYMVVTKSQNTGSLVSQALASDWNPLVRKQLERFALQLLHRPVEFNACGLFYLDRGLMTSIAGAVTTYLVILVQFQNDDGDETKELLQNASYLLNDVNRAEKS